MAQNNHCRLLGILLLAVIFTGGKMLLDIWANAQK